MCVRSASAIAQVILRKLYLSKLSITLAKHKVIAMKWDYEELYKCLDGLWHKLIKQGYDVRCDDFFVHYLWFEHSDYSYTLEQTFIASWRWGRATEYTLHVCLVDKDCSDYMFEQNAAWAGEYEQDQTVSYRGEVFETDHIVNIKLY